MNRETEAYFSELPNVEISRSKFKRDHSVKDTWNDGELIVLDCQEILPGDTVEMKMGGLVRMTTPLFPTMDNCYLDIYAFYVPTRLVWNHWAEFWGENNQTHWEQPIEYEIPIMKAPADGFKKGSLADHFGIPTNVPNLEFSALPFRGYCKIVNDWFRDENLKDPCMINMDETTITGKNYDASTYDYTTDTQLGAKPYTVAKFHDYFTSASVAMQKGPAIRIPLGATAPIVGAEPTVKVVAGNATQLYGKQLNSVRSNDGSFTLYSEGATDVQYNGQNLGLVTDLSDAVSATVSELRMSFAVQRYYEALSLHGSRYIEWLKGIFGVTSPDARLQRSEYLGGAVRIPINIDTVLQTSATNDVSPQGNTGAFSCTSFAEDLFTKSFVEHGYVFILGCCRTEKSYQQGLQRFWSRKKWSDFYIPQFANLSAMPILNKEIYAQGTTEDDEAFAWQEAWADYRYCPNTVKGAFRSNYATTMDSWHYADDYDSCPRFSGTWIDEDKSVVDRTLVVQSSVEDQFFGDFYFDTTWVRPMPVYSIPGLIDHH